MRAFHRRDPSQILTKSTAISPTNITCRVAEYARAALTKHGMIVPKSGANYASNIHDSLSEYPRPDATRPPPSQERSAAVSRRFVVSWWGRPPLALEGRSLATPGGCSRCVAATSLALPTALCRRTISNVAAAASGRPGEPTATLATHPFKIVTSSWSRRRRGLRRWPQGRCWSYVRFVPSPLRAHDP